MAESKVSTPTPQASSTPIGGEKETKPNTTSGVSSPKKVIPAGDLGGTYSLDFYNAQMGVDLTDPLEVQEEEDAAKEMEEFLKEAKTEKIPEVKEEGDEDEEGGEDDEEVKPEGEEEKEEDSAKEEPEATSDKKFIKAKDTSGKEVDLDPDLIILKKIDGEVQEIRLEDHLDIVAGELTVNQRLGKLASFKDSLEKKLEFTQKRETQFLQNIEGIQKHLESGDHIQAFSFMAEVAGKSPVQMYKEIMIAAENAAAKFQGMSAEQVENFFLKLEIDHQKNKSQASSKAQEAADKKAAWESKLMGVLKDEGVSVDEFKEAVSQLSSDESWKSMDPDDRADAAIEKVLSKKHDDLITTALKKVSPILVKNQKLVSLIKEYTHPNKWTVLEIETLARQLVKDEEKRIATSLSKNVGTQKKPATSQKTDAKSTKKTFTTYSELERSFGLGSKS